MFQTAKLVLSANRKTACPSCTGVWKARHHKGCTSSHSETRALRLTSQHVHTLMQNLTCFQKAIFAGALN